MNSGSSDQVTNINPVNSAGPWIICRSKSHSGRIYYFNTLTGDAAWNLSESEIEKAKRRTSSLPNQAGTDGCPEPKEPPMDPEGQPVQRTYTRHISEPSTVYNKQIINNKFPKPTYPQSPFMVPSCGLIANPINSILPFVINAENSRYNSNVWSMPPSQFYVAPPVSLYNNPEPSFHVGYRRQDILVQTASNSHSRNRTFSAGPLHRNFERQNFKQNNKFVPRNKQTKSNNRINCDLRAFLTAKRQRRVTHSEDEAFEAKGDNEGNEEECNIEQLTEPSHNVEEVADASHCDVIENQMEKDEHGDADSDWLEDNIVVQEGQLKLDVTNLKKLAKPNMDLTCWYIAVDKDILLNHLNFLNILYQSDEVCCLLVPDKVEEELNMASRENDARMGKRAIRACTFLSQHRDAGSVVTGKAACDTNITRSQYLINCCNNLLERNFHVILLTNETEPKTLKNTSIPIFTISEIKEFITKPFATPDTTEDKSSEEALQKINNFNKIGTTDTGITEKGSQESPEPKVLVTLEDTQSVPNSGQPNKCVTEIGTQTDAPSLPEEPSNTTDNATKFPKPAESTNIQTVSKSEPHNTTQSRRQIRLNRNKSNTIAADHDNNNEQNKQFKWRKRRNLVSGQQTGSSNLSLDKNCAHTQTSEDHEKNTDDNTELTNTNHESVPLPPHNRSSESISKYTNDGSETSSTVNRNPIHESIVIEETSSSHVSNTISNMDSESENERCVSNQSFNLTDVIQSPKNVMFEVKDKEMEEYLKIKLDEWISRFIQIMEEVLTQVLLRQNKRFLRDVVYQLYGGGPWTVRDAAECIKIKFCRHRNVVDAANKLINTFVKISDDAGRISTNISPSKYMEMYSYGVNIVNTLQSVIKCCEDLEIANQSLSKLLNDIQNPQLDACPDTFVDSIQESIGDVNDVSHSTEDLNHQNSLTDSVNSYNKNVKEYNHQNSVSDSMKSSNENLKYNLRSRSNKLSQNEDKPRVAALEKEEKTNQEEGSKNQDSFFMSLNLKKKDDDFNIASAEKNLPLTPQNVASETNKEHDIFTSLEEASVKSTTTSEYANNKNLIHREPLDLDELDYNAYNDKDDNSDDLNDNSELEEPHQTKINSQDEGEFYKDIDNSNYMKPSVNANNNVDLISYRILREIKEAMVDVHSFCVSTHKELCDDVLLNGRRSEMLREAEEVQMLIDKLCGTLASIFHRETYTPENNFQSLLKRAGIIDPCLACTQLIDYRGIISKCLNQAKLLQKSVTLILNVVRNKPIK